MSSAVRLESDGRFTLLLQGEPDYCQAFPMAPSGIEPELRKGTWLLLLFAVWSVPDRQAIPLALTAVEKLKGRVRLGVRPFDDHKEILAWCPDVKERWGSPLWLILRDGRLVEERVGILTEAEIYNMARPFVKCG